MVVNKDSWIMFGIGVLVGMLLIVLANKNFGPHGELINNPDTAYNKVKLDSIKFKVGQHDTTIYKLNIKLKDDVQKSYQLNDTDAVNMFKQLSKGSTN